MIIDGEDMQTLYDAWHKEEEIGIDGIDEQQISDIVEKMPNVGDGGIIYFPPNDPILPIAVKMGIVRQIGMVSGTNADTIAVITKTGKTLL